MGFNKGDRQEKKGRKGGGENFKATIDKKRPEKEKVTSSDG